MAVQWQDALLVGVASAAIDLDEAARRLIAEGLDAEALSEVEEFVGQLNLDPSARDRALLLIERTRLLAEDAAVVAHSSDRLRAQAEGTQPSGVAAALVDLSSVWSHELSAPLAIAHLALETLALHRDDPAMVDRMVAVARRNLRLASHLLRGLSSVGELRTGRVELSWAQLDLGELVRECADDVGAVLAGQHEIDVAVEQPVETPGDRDAIRQILINLLTNAAKFSPDTSRIEIVVAATPEHTEVAVRDQGSGLSQQDAERIFEAGQRLDPDTPGMGLGLFIARQLARAHGGDLHVQQPAGGGSRFVLRLPRSPTQWQHSLERREQASVARAAGQRERDAIADARNGTLDQREDIAAQRDALLTDREAVAEERDAELDRRDGT